MNAKSSKKKVNSVIKTFLKRRLIELLGIFVIFISAFFFISFFTYDPHDPSYNLASNAMVHNWGGIYGAYIAVPILQFIGFASFLFFFVPFTWGGEIVRYKKFQSPWIKITCFIISLPIFASLISSLDFFIDSKPPWVTLDLGDDDSFGGVLGKYLSSSMVSETSPIWLLYLYFFVNIVLAVTSLLFACSLQKRTWINISKNIGLAAYFVLHKIYLLFRSTILLFLRKGKQAGKKKEINKAVDKKEKKQGKYNILKRREKKTTKKQEQASLDLGIPNEYHFPNLSLLQNKKVTTTKLSENALKQNAELLEKILKDFSVKGKIVEVSPGPVVTLYSLEPSAGTKSSRVIGLADDIARSISAVSARISVIPGKNVIGIELPNSDRETVFLKEVLNSEEYKKTKAKLPLGLGKDIGGNPIVIDLAKTPHLLVAGTTGSGKSVGINTMILSLLYKYTPEECKFIMVDPKMLELSVYQDIPHLLTPVVTEPEKAITALKWTVREMESRYRAMSCLGVRNIYGYNEKIEKANKKGEVLKRSVQTGFDTDTGDPIIEEVPFDMKPFPFIVVIVDEMADLMLVAGKEIEASIQRLAQMARAAGIHVILATQRPSVDVITGIIKANFPSRISFQVTSKIDSRTILGEQGGEQLLGMGDMLYMGGAGKTIRVHGPFVDDDEVERVVSHLKKQGKPSYIEDVTVSTDEDISNFAGNVMGNNSGGSEKKDELYNEAVKIVLRDKKTSTSYVQRSLRIGYNRAANIIEEMQKEGILTEPDHTGKRRIVGQE